MTRRELLTRAADTEAIVVFDYMALRTPDGAVKRTQRRARVLGLQPEGAERPDRLLAVDLDVDDERNRRSFKIDRITHLKEEHQNV